MTDNSKKISELPLTSNVAITDRLLVLKDPLGNASVRTVNLSTLSANLVLSFSTPANSSANGLQGTISYDQNYLYVCISKNTWKRTQLLDW